MSQTVPKGECWEPWRVLAETPVVPTRSNLKAKLFLGTRFGSLGDAREIFQGDGHCNQCRRRHQWRGGSADSVAVKRAG